MATIWKGAINFGLINIPVKLLSAVSAESISFRGLHKKCKTPLSQKRWCNTCNKEVEYSDVVKGYEIAKNTFVEITEQDFKSVPVKSSKYIQILDFIKLDEVDPIYFKKAYYLEAEATGEKPYLILYNAMKETKSVAVSKITIRDKEHLCLVRIFNDILMLNTMYFGDEVISTISLNMDSVSRKVEVLDMEAKMARQLVENLTAPFDIGKYHDEHREQMLKLITAKSEGAEIVTPDVSVPEAVNLDLFEKLKKSLEMTQTAGQ